MDNITHSLTGLMLSRAGLNRLSPRANWLLFFAANVPDADAISALGGAEVYFVYHRWITHSLIMMPVMAILPVIVVRVLFRQKLNWFKAWLAAMVGVASHLALDSTNSYAIRLLLPWSDVWLSLDTTSIVDIWIWAVLALALSAPAISSLVSSEIGARKTTGRGWAIFALAFLLCYNTGRYFLHQRAVEIQQGRVYEGLAPRHVLAFPTSVNPLLWRGFVETEEFWSAHDVNLAGDFDPAQGRLFFKPERSPAVDAAMQTPLFQHFLGFSKAPICHNAPAEDPPSYTQVECRDLRFGFTAAAVVDEQVHVQRTWFHF
jgi:inner membrane protein